MVERNMAARILASVGLCFLASCITGGPGDNVNENGTEEPSLSEAQKTAVDTVVAQVVALGEALASFVAVENLDLGDQPGEPGEPIGECPAVSFDIEQFPAFIITLDYADGCESTLYPGKTVGGAVIITTQFESQDLTLTFNDFAVDERVTTGTAALSAQDAEQDVVWTVELDLAASGVGSAEGAITMRFDVQRPEEGETTVGIFIDDGELALTDLDDETLAVTLAGLVMQPTENGTFMPEAGTASFELPSEGPMPVQLTVTIAFTEQSPVDGTVQVTVGEAEPIEYQVPGFGDGE